MKKIVLSLLSLAASTAFAQKKIPTIDPPKTNASQNSIIDLLFGYANDTLGSAIPLISVIVYMMIGIAIVYTFNEAKDKGRWSLFLVTLVMSVIAGTFVSILLTKAQSGLA